MKRIISMLLVVVMIFGFSHNVSAAGTRSAAGTSALSVGKVTAQAGTDVVVPISISNNVGICGATITVSYDSNLVLKNVEAGNAFSSLVMTKPGRLTDNPVKILWDGVDADRSNGIIANLTFKAPSKSGTYAVNVNCEAKDVIDANLSPVQMTITNGNITVGAATTTNPFTDVSTRNYYYEPVMWAVENDITGGTSDTTFSPTRLCSRAQVVTFLWKANGSPEPTKNTNPFTDISTKNYYYKAVLWAVEKGITDGATATTFAPNKECTREQVVTFLWNAADKPEPQSTTNVFTDVSSKKYYYKAVQWAVQNGIAEGTSKTTFGTGKICNRAQVVTFLYNAYK